MTDLAGCNPTGRFTGLAQNYAKYRPSYPEVAVDYLLNRCQLGSQSLLVDVGCGTGISSRLFASRGIRVIGIDPNSDMRSKAEAEPALPDSLTPVYRDGRAEATGLPAGCADAVLAAQAFHWFVADLALQEFCRILKPGGWVALIWNERDETDPFTAHIGAVMRSGPGAAELEKGRSRAGEALLESSLFQDARREGFRHGQTLNEDGLLGRALSASYAPREPAQVAEFTACLRDIFARYQQNGLVNLCYETSAYTGRARDAR